MAMSATANGDPNVFCQVNTLTQTHKMFDFILEWICGNWVYWYHYIIPVSILS